jgi:selenocysteine-specific elongation factor
VTTALPFVVGTAGHIDHGKTALVRAITGIDTDRLAVEKARGITTELGFAHLDLPSGRRVAVVDVPGHERFIRAMVAGATGLDLVVLVIAADSGVMPQTREHLEVCQLLGVRRGIVAITKRDLVDDDWLALLDDDLTHTFAGTFLATAPRLPVSAKTGIGLDHLVAAIDRVTHELPARPTTGLLRVPIDRVFTLHGFGTVVTGTVVSGSIAVGEELAVYPRRFASRVRGLHVHGAPVDRAVAGQRVAINLHGLAIDDVARGDVVGHSSGLAPAHVLDVCVRHIAAATAALPPRAKVLLHHGTTQVMATLSLVDGKRLAPGVEGFGQLRIDRATPLAALPGDRFLIRGFTPLANHGTTLGGGEIIRVQAAKLRYGTTRAGEQAAMMTAFSQARAADRVSLELQAAAAALPSLIMLAMRVGATAAELTGWLAALVERGEVVQVGDDLMHATTLAALERKVVDLLTTAPDATMLREELRQRLPVALPMRGFELVMSELTRRGTIVVAADVVRRPSAAMPGRHPDDDTVLARFRSWGLEPPRPADVAAAVGQTPVAVKAAIDRLVFARLVTKIKPDYYVATEAVDRLKAKLLGYFETEREISPQAWKELTGTTRKFSIPLAEYFDAMKVTLRVGDQRRKR